MGTQGWLPHFGKLNILAALSLIIGGTLIALPDLAIIGINTSEVGLDGLGLLIIALGLLYQLFSTRSRKD